MLLRRVIGSGLQRWAVNRRAYIFRCHFPGANVVQMLSRVLVMRCAFLGCLLASASASASNESLSFRSTPSGSIEAIVSGTDSICDVIFLPSIQVTLEGETLTITSPDGLRFCPIPGAPRPYEVATDLGILRAQRYVVVWNQPIDGGVTHQVSAILVPSAIVGGAVAMSAPTLSWWGLAALALALGAFAIRHRNFTRSNI